MLRFVILIWSGSATGNVQQRYINYMDSFSNPTAFSARPTASVSETELNKKKTIEKVSISTVFAQS